MTMHPKLAEVREGVGSGLLPDLHSMQAFVWADGRNVRFTGRSVKKMDGWNTPLTKPGTTPVRGKGQVLDTGGGRLCSGGIQRSCITGIRLP